MVLLIVAKIVGDSATAKKVVSLTRTSW